MEHCEPQNMVQIHTSQYEHQWTTQYIPQSPLHQVKQDKMNRNASNRIPIAPVTHTLYPQVLDMYIAHCCMNTISLPLL